MLSCCNENHKSDNVRKIDTQPIQFVDMRNPEMTKRETIAMAAMQAILSGQDTEEGWSEEHVAMQAVSQADALLKALNNQK